MAHEGGNARTGIPRAVGATVTRADVTSNESDLEEPLLIRTREDVEETCWCHGCACLCCVTAVTCLRCFTAIKAPWLIFSLALFGILVVMTGSHQDWTLNAGESRRFQPSWLTRAVKLQVTTPHTTAQVDVFALPDKCPPLTGPLVNVDQNLDMTFRPGEYQYDFFYLNKGSMVEAQLTQIQGTSQVYLFRGQDKVDILTTTHSGSQEENWFDDLLPTAIQQWTIQDNAPQVPVRFRVDRNDVFALVYDNPYKNTGHLNADLWLTMTSYNLTGYSPICRDLAFHSCAPIATEKLKCLLLATYSPYDQGNQVSLAIVQNRDYAFLLMLSLVPVVLGLAWDLWRCLRRPSSIPSWQDPDAIPVSRDPPTVPPTPSAPPAHHDPEVIPIATAQVLHPTDEK